MRRFSPISMLVAAILRVAALGAVQPEVTELSFDTHFEKPGALQAAQAPPWVVSVEQQGGRFLDDPRCWQAAAAEREGIGRLAITLDRRRINEDLAATILFDADDSADLAVQLFDAQGRVVEIDLFGNLVEVGREAITDTFIVPLRKYPTADKIVLRRIRGNIKVYGIVLFPAVTDGTPNHEALKKLAAVLGDPLSPENPLLKGLQQIARSGKIALQPARDLAPPPLAAATPQPRGNYRGATAPAAGTKAPPAPVDGLLGYWSFDRADANDASGRRHHGQLRGGARFAASPHGQALRLRKNPSTAREVRWDSVTVPVHPDLNLHDTMTLAAWVNYASIAPVWGSQIVWFGDPQYGRDPWELHVLRDGTLEFRSDRSVTGAPVFTVFESEIHLSPEGKPMLNQHVAVSSPGTLVPDTWYFVAATMEKVTPRLRALRLYVNAELVGEVRTAETVNYPTEGMGMTIGAVDEGTWQNFDGTIDEVRVYDRALTLAELQALYRQPWQ